MYLWLSIVWRPASFLTYKLIDSVRDISHIVLNLKCVDVLKFNYQQYTRYGQKQIQVFQFSFEPIINTQWSFSC